MQSLLRPALRSRYIGHAIERSVLALARLAEAERKSMLRTQPNGRPVSDTQRLSALAAALTVRNGNFAGMKYPSLTAIGSTLFPKLLGSYEQELAPVWRRIFARADSYTEVIDIGCAEGFYAVGLARRLPNAKIYAFDTNPAALRQCCEMAQLNGVADRIFTYANCTPETLRGTPVAGRALIISDCEGYEKQLFTYDLVPHLAQHELVIEVHDFLDIDISTQLRDVFAATHEVAVYSSIDDIKKAQSYDYPELAGLDLAQRKQVLAEGRPAIMEWFHLTPHIQPCAVADDCGTKKEQAD